MAESKESALGNPEINESIAGTDQNQIPKMDEQINSENLFPESPVYEPDDVILTDQDKEMKKPLDTSDQTHIQAKRKLSSDTDTGSTPKMQKLEKPDSQLSDTQSLDNEVSDINTSATKKKFALDDLSHPSTSRVRTPVRSSPRKITKRSNSTTEVTKTPKTPKTPKVRSASTDITRKTPRKKLERTNSSSSSKEKIETITISSDSSNTKESMDCDKKILDATDKTKVEPIAEEIDLNDSQDIKLVMSPTPDDTQKNEIIKSHSSDPVNVKDRTEVLSAGKINQPHSEGYNYSDQADDIAQPRRKESKGMTTDLESTDSVGSIILDSPDTIPSVPSRMITKLSNGNSSTPTEILSSCKHSNSLSEIDSDNNTPDMSKVNGQKGKDMKHVSNTTTPSTISPLPNGHSLPINTSQIPTFDVHTNYNEEGELHSLYAVRTDNDLGMDMCKEFQRVSKRFTIDPYMADVSVSNSPSSVTSTGMINLPIRISSVSTTSSTSTASSNRTSDGAFVVPQPPRKSVSNPSTTTVKGHEGLIKKLQDIISHLRECSTIDETHNTSGDVKVSVGIQASLSSSSQSNGNASPEEVTNCDKVTPRSSLKKPRVRGRRPLTGKTKRVILPTQLEETEYMHGMNSPEMVISCSENGNTVTKSIKEEKPSSTPSTPKSIAKLKQKRNQPASPRPATPVEKALVKTEFSGHAPDTVVLAKWVDKRYYSGKILEMTEPNKYLIKFDDGQSKALLDDFIIFGDTKTLPLLGHSVYTMVDEDQNYEPGLVLGIEENGRGTVTYRCVTDGETTVCVTASELYLTEDQARNIQEITQSRSPSSLPTTPRRRGLRELDLDNIIQGPRSARSRDKGNGSARKRIESPKSPKASTSGVKWTGGTAVVGRKRVGSESSELSDVSSAAAPTAARLQLDEVAGVEREVQRTPRKIDGLKAGPLQLKGAAKQNIGKKNSKLAKFENDEDTVSLLGPIPPKDSKLFAGMHFLLTCTEQPKTTNVNKPVKQLTQESRQYSSEEDGETTSTDCEQRPFSERPFNKERLRRQLEAGGGTVHSALEGVPRAALGASRLLAPRPCLTAKYIACAAAGVAPLSHAWALEACARGRLPPDADAFALPLGWSLLRKAFVHWTGVNNKRNTNFFKDKIILLCGDQDTFVKFWEKVCTLCGATTRVVNEEDLNMSGALALVTEWDCPHEVQNKANQDNIPLVSTTWVVQCLIEGRILSPTCHEKFSFMYTEPE